MDMVAEFPPRAVPLAWMGEVQGTQSRVENEIRGTTFSCRHVRNRYNMHVWYRGRCVPSRVYDSFRDISESNFNHHVSVVPSSGGLGGEERRGED